MPRSRTGPQSGPAGKSDDRLASPIRSAVVIDEKLAPFGEKNRYWLAGISQESIAGIGIWSEKNNE
mgnify:CR=1 FL=1